MSNTRLASSLSFKHLHTPVFKINIFYYFARTVHGKVKQYMNIKSIMLMYKDNIYDGKWKPIKA